MSKERGKTNLTEYTVVLCNQTKANPPNKEREKISETNEDRTPENKPRIDGSKTW